MADSKPGNMPSDFHKWYRAVNLNSSPETLAARWKGVVNAVGKITREEIESVIRIIFHSKHPPSVGSLARIRKAFQDCDSSFEMEENGREFEVLCGAILALLFEEENDKAAAAALSVTTASFNGQRVLNLPMDLLVLSENALLDISQILRRRPDLKKYIAAASPKIGFDTAIAKIKEGFNLDNTAASFALMAESIGNALTKMDARISDTIKGINSFIASQDEELQILWWFVGECSWDFKTPFANLGDAQPLVLAKELAAMTQYSPGPPSIRGLLARAGLSKDEKLTIPAAVNACDSAWLKRIANNSTPCAVSQPIHFAISRKLETCDEDSWIAGWAAVSGLDAGRELSPMIIAYLFYRERLLSLF